MVKVALTEAFSWSVAVTFRAWLPASVGAVPLKRRVVGLNSSQLGKAAPSLNVAV